jgi:twitching motility protein PilT
MENLNKLFRTALQYHASDLYISTGSKPTLRVNGELFAIEEHPVLDKKIAESYLLEILAEPLKKQFSQESDIDFSLEVPELGRFRVNIFIQRHGITGVFRVIPSTPIPLEALQLPESVKDLTQLHQGLVLITGPAGCGKSTTLASVINDINQNQRKHIITIEDPIEFVHGNGNSIIEQREIGGHTVSFQRALRASLREDPDVILLGEMRDLETIGLAITAAETGHLVLSTLHTQGAANAIDRIIDVFPPNQQAQVRTQLAATLQAIVWQKLLPCTTETVNQTKRIAAVEILRNNHAIRNMIRKGNTHQIQSMIETGRKEGMQTMNQALEQLLAEKKITKETYEAHRAQKEE